MHEHFNARYLQATLSVDSGTGTVPMNHEVNTPAQVTGHFGTISYNKAASFLRMTVNMITPITFRKACQYFLRDKYVGYYSIQFLFPNKKNIKSKFLCLKATLCPSVH